MTDPVRPVGLELRVEQWRQWVRLIFTHLTADNIAPMTDRELQRVVCEAADANRAAAPVPCAASPADETPTREWLMKRVAFYAREYERQLEIIKRWQIQDWRTINTAPQDGSWFLAWGEDIGFIVFRMGPGFIAAEEPDPTHWMPLPTPPRATGEGARDARPLEIANDSGAAALSGSLNIPTFTLSFDPLTEQDVAGGYEIMRAEDVQHFFRHRVQILRATGDRDEQEAERATQGRAPRADTSGPRARAAGSGHVDDGRQGADHMGRTAAACEGGNGDRVPEAAPPVAVSLDPHRLPLQGSWAADDWRRAFVEGAQWWEWTKAGATMWPSDRNMAEGVAEERFARLRGEATVRVEE